MAGNDVTIQLTAKDGASNVFKTVGRSASDMGKQVDTAGKTSESSLGRMSKAGAVAGAAFTALAGVASLAAHANAEAEASQARLSTAIENTGHSLFEYQDQLDAAGKKALQLGFDDEDAADSIAKMTTATGDAQTAINDLAIAEDIARARNIDLASATNIVIAAEQGRIGALKRVGIEVDASMSKEQVMDALRQKFAGNAEAYSTTTAAGFDRLRNSTENALEAIGAHLGPANELLMILPGLSAGFTGVGAVVGALAPEFSAAAAGAALLNVALGPVGLAALTIGALAGVLLLGDGLGNNLAPGEEAANAAAQKLNETLRQQLEIGSVVAPLTKQVGDSFTAISAGIDDYNKRLTDAQHNQQTATDALDTMNQNYAGQIDILKPYQDRLDTANSALAAFNIEADKGTVSQTQLADAQSAANDILTSTQAGSEGARQQLKHLTDQVNSGAILWSTYTRAVIGIDKLMPQVSLSALQSADSIQKTTDAMNGGSAAGKEVINTLTGYRQSMAVVGDQFTTLDGQIGGTTTHITDFTNRLTGAGQGSKVLGDYFTNMADGASYAGATLADEARATNEANAAAAAATAKLKEQEGAYYGLRDGVTSAKDAQAIFKQTQDGIISSQDQYTGQLSEYQTQLGYITDAETLLNQRKADGIPLTAAQTDFLNRAGDAEARLSGGTDDATIALGMQAEQYAENMKIGDEMNRLLGDQTSSTDTLTATLNTLILALQGIPGYVNTTITADTTAASNNLAYIKQQLDELNGRTSYASVVIQSYYTGPGVGYTPGDQLGGVIPHAQHGATMNSSPWFWVGEAGAELTNGQMIVPHTSSVETSRGKGGGGGDIHIHGGVTVVANDPRQFSDQMRSYNFGYGARS